jgi:phosphatidylglycerol:prolipoprotein diacylglycerol transferase
MLMYPNINPVAFHIGSWPVYWYGVMYLLGFTAAWGLLTWRRRLPWYAFTKEQVADLIFYGALGVIIGGRVGYVTFYDWPVFFNDPLIIFQTWKGGMSFHGGLIGVLLSLYIYSRKLKCNLLTLTDFIAPIVPIGLGAGRIGNFINGELWGRVTDLPWGMVFPYVDLAPRHPSQLYECLLEGVVLFIVLWLYSSRARPMGAVSGMFALGYGLLRIIAEFFREPDAQIGYIAFGWLTEGQLLSLPLVLLGVILLSYAYTHKSKVAGK